MEMVRAENAPLSFASLHRDGERRSACGTFGRQSLYIHAAQHSGRIRLRQFFRNLRDPSQNIQRIAETKNRTGMGVVKRPRTDKIACAPHCSGSVIPKRAGKVAQHLLESIRAPFLPGRQQILLARTLPAQRTPVSPQLRAQFPRARPLVCRPIIETGRRFPTAFLPLALPARFASSRSNRPTCPLAKYSRHRARGSVEPRQLLPATARRPVAHVPEPSRKNRSYDLFRQIREFAFECDVMLMEFFGLV
jgi:hypothetical protein